MARGTLIWFDEARGFGFVRPEFGPRDVFLHVSALVDPADPRLAPGQRLEFELVQTGDGRVIARRAVRLDMPADRRRRDPGPA